MGFSCRRSASRWSKAVMELLANETKAQRVPRGTRSSLELTAESRVRWVCPFHQGLLSLSHRWRGRWLHEAYIAWVSMVSWFKEPITGSTSNEVQTRARRSIARPFQTSIASQFLQFRGLRSIWVRRWRYCLVIQVTLSWVGNRPTLRCSVEIRRRWRAWTRP